MTSDVIAVLKLRRMPLLPTAHEILLLPVFSRFTQLQNKMFEKEYTFLHLLVSHTTLGKLSQVSSVTPLKW